MGVACSWRVGSSNSSGTPFAALLVLLVVRLLTRAAAPWPVMCALGISAFKAMGAEEVALRLDQVRCAAALPIAVEIGERRRKRRHRQSGLHRLGDDTS